MSVSCPFCAIDRERLLAESGTCIAIRDVYPVTAGHALVMPRKHVLSVYELPAAEQAELWALVGTVRGLLMERFGVDSLNIGLNDGLSAGQTVAHAHVHVIPRRPGDVPDPRGGIRWVIPNMAKYWH